MKAFAKTDDCFFYSSQGELELYYYNSSFSRVALPFLTACVAISLFLTFCFLMQQFNKHFSDHELSKWKNFLKWSTLSFTISFSLLAVYSMFSGLYSVSIKSFFIRMLLNYTLNLVWDLPILLSMLLLHFSRLRESK